MLMCMHSVGVYNTCIFTMCAMCVYVSVLKVCGCTCVQTRVEYCVEKWSIFIPKSSLLI